MSFFILREKCLIFVQLCFSGFLKVLLEGQGVLGNKCLSLQYQCGKDEIF